MRALVRHIVGPGWMIHRLHRFSQFERDAAGVVGLPPHHDTSAAPLNGADSTWILTRSNCRRDSYLRWKSRVALRDFLCLRLQKSPRRLCIFSPRIASSMVEQETLNLLVVGSSPTRCTIKCGSSLRVDRRLGTCEARDQFAGDLACGVIRGTAKERAVDAICGNAEVRAYTELARRCGSDSCQDS